MEIKQKDIICALESLDKRGNDIQVLEQIRARLKENIDRVFGQGEFYRLWQERK